PAGCSDCWAASPPGWPASWHPRPRGRLRPEADDGLAATTTAWRPLGRRAARRARRAGHGGATGAAGRGGRGRARIRPDGARWPAGCSDCWAASPPGWPDSWPHRPRGRLRPEADDDLAATTTAWRPLGRRAARRSRRAGHGGAAGRARPDATGGGGPVSVPTARGNPQAVPTAGQHPHLTGPPVGTPGHEGG